MKRNLVLTFLIAAIVAVACALPAHAAPRVTVRANNAVTLRGVAAIDATQLDTPFGVLGVRLSVEGYPFDGGVLLICDGLKECERIRRGDAVLARGELRINPIDSKAYVVATKINLKEAGR